jgi:hypothetical protein
LVIVKKLPTQLFLILFSLYRFLDLCVARMM